VFVQRLAGRLVRVGFDRHVHRHGFVVGQFDQFDPNRPKNVGADPRADLGRDPLFLIAPPVGGRVQADIMVQVQPGGMLPVRRGQPDIVFRQQPVAAAVGVDLVQRPMPVIGPRTFGSGQREEGHEGVSGLKLYRSRGEERRLFLRRSFAALLCC